MSQTVLQLDNVEFRRNRRVIITDVNLTINAGERWVLFGPNGIGKSTAVGMLATRTFPSEGRVFILGHQLGKYDVFKLRTRIGLASADLGRQFPEFEDPLDAVVTGLSAVTGRWRDTYTDEEYARARQLLRDFRVSYLEGKEMWRLSEGERTRVLIARALMGDPELLIMDEPTTGLDLGGREQVMRTLSRIGEESSERRGLGYSPSGGDSGRLRSHRHYGSQADSRRRCHRSGRRLNGQSRCWHHRLYRFAGRRSNRRASLRPVRHAHRSPAHSRPLGRLRRVMPFWSPPAEAVGQADWGRCQQYFSFFGRFYFSLRPLWRGLSA